MAKNNNKWLAILIVGILAFVAINSSGLLQGSATICPPTQKAIAGVCSTYCGNNVCEKTESCLTCAKDCGTCICIDNDGGVDARVPGTCESSAMPLQEFKDSCQGSNVLKYYCPNENKCKQAVIECVRGCSNG